jgi:hypothetical protein
VTLLFFSVGLLCLFVGQSLHDALDLFLVSKVIGVLRFLLLRLQHFSGIFVLLLQFFCRPCDCKSIKNDFQK